MSSISEQEYMSFWQAAQTGDIECVRHMISQGIQIDRRNKDGWTALHIATVNGQYEIRQMLIVAQGRKLNGKAVKASHLE